MDKLSHIDEKGAAHMVDVSEKAITSRTAIAEGYIHMSTETLNQIKANSLKKGDVLATARIAGIMAAKKTSELIPLCHPLAITKVTVDFDTSLKNKIRVETLVKVGGQTGVEMEALSAASTALLTIYDMAKAVQKDMIIDGIRLLSKEGGKSGKYEAIDT
ncbi:cyclic pyranopterin monophosphate synthase MoaC [Kordiimonas sp. SCSIO 12610]|uniref:cyclic pyranopterin monophosphate synthase MoaC n=1 Tax=Kordiimonas sp. SCSIO 12610 TaxID=2829597 RepID=UPI00210BE220|nr:cyclic pyranopterin monophosphate synthase MoaC [Kordiimonas sp. SCSIO 12610]UTW54041.1 cyclic pyranopterin monophosphate synthase MoaC [Kordiimonas sp. SCSIO 12610]